MNSSSISSHRPKASLEAHHTLSQPYAERALLGSSQGGFEPYLVQQQRPEASYHLMLDPTRGRDDGFPRGAAEAMPPNLVKYEHADQSRLYNVDDFRRLEARYLTIKPCLKKSLTEFLFYLSQLLQEGRTKSGKWRPFSSLLSFTKVGSNNIS